MPGRTKQAFEVWRNAEAAARDAERRLAEAWEQYERGGSVPADDLVGDVKRLRDVAGKRLAEAIRMLDSARKT